MVFPGKAALEAMWKAGAEEVKTMNRQLSKKTDWKGRKRKRTEARGRSGDRGGLLQDGGESFTLTGC